MPGQHGIDPALGYLLLHRPLGAVRRFRRGLDTARGRILFFGLLLLLALIFSSPLLRTSSLASNPGAAGESRIDDILLFAPPALLLIALIGIRAGAFYFKPAEIQFLFPAPIPRAQLLVYNILSRLQIAFLSAIWVSFFSLRHASTWYGGFLAMFALLIFNQLTAQLGGIWAASFPSNASATPTRWLRWLVAVFLIVGAVGYTLPPLPEDFSDAARILAAHPIIHGMSWLTRPFVKLFLAPSGLQTALWGGVTAAILLVEIKLMLKLDAVQFERMATNANSLRKSQRPSQNTFPSNSADMGQSRIGFRIPILAFPELRGAGPIAWRQCQELVRNPASLLRGGLGLLAVIPVALVRLSANGANGADEGVRIFSVIAALLMIPMMIDGADFRRDLDRIPVLKSLPLRAKDIALGQILPTALLISFWMVLGGLLIFGGSGHLTLPVAYLLALLVPPIALIMAAVDNWLFLLMPYRIRTRDPGESTFVGRLTIVMTVKMIVLLLSIGLGFTAVVATWNHVAKSVVLAGLVASATLALCCIPAVSAVARAFQNFDVADGSTE